MRAASQGGTWPPWRGRSATPERFTIPLKHSRGILRKYLLPAFDQILDGGRKALASIEKAFREDAGEPGWESDEFQRSLRGTTLQLSEVLETIDQKLNEGHRETLADLSAIGGALRKLADLSGMPPVRAVPAPHRKTTAMAHATARGAGKILIADDDDANRDLLRRRRSRSRGRRT